MYAFPVVPTLLGCSLLLYGAGCRSQSTTGNDPGQDTMHPHTNRLIHETSPYLLQHAHNPVDWYPWGEEAFAKARAENKLVLVSIGYSSCHWCHVMERESFENDSLAKLMNDHFVCIKVDREERPDIDQVYMSAVQLMTGRGGWPLNCFVLPDGRPVYGGTYFPPAQWKQLLADLHTTWSTDPAKVLAYAARLHDGVKQSDLIALEPSPAQFERADLAEMVAVMDSSFDRVDGGTDHAPKFPMPNDQRFLLKYARLTHNTDLERQVQLTLHKMALGGIFDQVGGGFARYSTDAHWKVPHFEKMLYDNAQLISLYCQAYQATQDPLYRDVAQRTLDFIAREMRGPDGACYSALDADSEGEEGRFYVWTRDELQQVLGANMAFATQYYHIDERGLWEHDRYILLRTEDDEAFARQHHLPLEEVRTTAARINNALLAAREKRPRPALDDKSLTSWNALMVSAWCDAYEVFGDPAHLAAARRTMDLLLTKCRRDDGGLWHSYINGKASINGYLEDYSAGIQALIALYQVTFEQRWLDEAKRLADHAILHFHDPASGMFWFTSDQDPPLIARKMEVTDNVIPASNSSLCLALEQLGRLYDKEDYLRMAGTGLNNVRAQMDHYPSGYTNWAQLMLMRVFPCYEIAITGPDALRARAAFAPHYLPCRIFLGSTGPSSLPLLSEKTSNNATTIFVCENKVCKLPVSTVEEALRELQ